jgi:hypothetical protein
MGSSVKPIKAFRPQRAEMAKALARGHGKYKTRREHLRLSRVPAAENANRTGLPKLITSNPSEPNSCLAGKLVAYLQELELLRKPGTLRGEGI